MRVICPVSYKRCFVGVERPSWPYVWDLWVSLGEGRRSLQEIPSTGGGLCRIAKLLKTWGRVGTTSRTLSRIQASKSPCLTLARRTGHARPTATQQALQRPRGQPHLALLLLRGMHSGGSAHAGAKPATCRQRRACAPMLTWDASAVIAMSLNNPVCLLPHSLTQASVRENPTTSAAGKVSLLPDGIRLSIKELSLVSETEVLN